MKNVLLTASLLIFSITANSQFYQQFFDGADTSASNSVIIYLDTNATNIWQIGPPQKTVFNTASSVPNVLVTDTINTYPDSVNSSFWFAAPIDQIFGGAILAIQWNQKLDMDSVTDGGIVEYSIDTGNTWINCFNDPNVYNFYGWNSINYDTLESTGEYCFTGQDPNSWWSNIWLCFDSFWLETLDTMMIRFTFKSDSINQNRDGWMIDNMYVMETWFHTIQEISGGEQFKVFPTVTDDGLIKIVTKEPNQENKITEIELIDMHGRIVKRYNDIEDVHQLDLSAFPGGSYHLKIITPTFFETFTIFLR